MELELIIPRQKFRVTVANYADASKKYRAYVADREDEGMGGASMNDPGLLIQGGQVVAHVSYNGRVWEGEHYVPGSEPVYDPAPQERADKLHKSLLAKAAIMDARRHEADTRELLRDLYEARAVILRCYEDLEGSQDFDALAALGEAGTALEEWETFFARKLGGL